MKNLNNNDSNTALLSQDAMNFHPFTEENSN